MRKFIVLWAVLILVLLAMVFIIVAQDDDGPNYCTDGTWYCPDPEHPGRESWNWSCGWYLAHYEADLISKGLVPSWCFIPTPVPTEVPPTAVPPRPVS